MVEMEEWAEFCVGDYIGFVIYQLVLAELHSSEFPFLGYEIFVGDLEGARVAAAPILCSPHTFLLIC